MHGGQESTLLTSASTIIPPRHDDFRLKQFSPSAVEYENWWVRRMGRVMSVGHVMIYTIRSRMKKSLCEEQGKRLAQVVQKLVG